MPELDRDGVPIHYEVTGSGPVVLFSHGYSATADMWRPQLEPIGSRYTLVTWDMRGHGSSGDPEDPDQYSEEHTVADMVAILDAVGAEKAAVGGLSLGGYMSLAFHRVHAERVAALLLFDTGPGYRNDEARDGWNANAYKTADRLEERGLDGIRRGAEAREARHRSAKGLAHAARGMLAQRDARVMDHLEKVDIPTLVLVGADDEPFLKATDVMAAKIPGATKVTIPDAGHAANIDQPEHFNDAVLAFLGGVQW